MREAEQATARPEEPPEVELSQAWEALLSHVEGFSAAQLHEIEAVLVFANLIRWYFKNR